MVARLISSEFLPFVTELAATSGIALPKLSLTQATWQVLEQRIPIKKKERTALESSARKRYIAAPLLHQQSSAPAVQQSLRALHDHVQGSIIRSKHESGAKVLSLSPIEATVLRERFSNLLIEEDRQYQLARRRSPIVGEIDQISTTAATTTTFSGFA